MRAVPEVLVRVPWPEAGPVPRLQALFGHDTFRLWPALRVVSCACVLLYITTTEPVIVMPPVIVVVLPQAPVMEARLQLTPVTDAVTTGAA